MGMSRHSLQNKKQINSFWSLVPWRTIQLQPPRWINCDLCCNHLSVQLPCLPNPASPTLYRWKERSSSPTYLQLNSFTHTFTSELFSLQLNRRHLLMSAHLHSDLLDVQVILNPTWPNVKCVWCWTLTLPYLFQCSYIQLHTLHIWSYTCICRFSKD